MTIFKEAKQCVKFYEKLIARAGYIVDKAPFHKYVHDENGLNIRFDGDEAVLSWCEYESDYYGDGYVENNETRLPAALLFLSDEELAAWQEKEETEEDERNAKVQAAQRAVERERQEAHERALLIQLKAKYETKVG